MPHDPLASARGLPLVAGWMMAGKAARNGPRSPTARRGSSTARYRHGVGTNMGMGVRIGASGALAAGGDGRIGGICQGPMTAPGPIPGRRVLDASTETAGRDWTRCVRSIDDLLVCD
jgi:hypothetical protein